jgi:hypothetical protein
LVKEFLNDKNMGLFVCENCKVIENTALGHYWARKFLKFKDSKMNGKALCSECTPVEFYDGSRAGIGKWHGKFRKEFFDANIHNSSDYLNV